MECGLDLIDEGPLTSFSGKHLLDSVYHLGEERGCGRRCLFQLLKVWPHASESAGGASDPSADMLILNFERVSSLILRHPSCGPCQTYKCNQTLFQLWTSIHSVLFDQVGPFRKPGLGPTLAPHLSQHLGVTGPVHRGPQRKALSVQGSGVSQSTLSCTTALCKDGGPLPSLTGHMSTSFLPNLLERESEGVASGLLRSWTLYPQSRQCCALPGAGLELCVHFIGTSTPGVRPMLLIS